MEKYLYILKKHGYKITSNRKEVLKNLLDSPKPITLNQIHSLCNKIDFATVYRIVNLYVSLGIVNEVKLLEKQKHFEIMGDDHHHHIICDRCGKIERLDLCVVEKAADLTDFQITNHTLEFNGLCPECLE